MKKILIILFLSAVSMNIKAQNLIINYQRVNDDYDGWKLWVWNKTENKNGFEINPETKTDFGIKFVLDLNKNNLLNKEIGILPKYGNWEKKESFDRILNHSGENEIFILEGDPKIYKSLKEIDISTQITGAYYDGEGKIRITLNRRVLTERLKDFYLTGKDTKKKIPLKKDSNPKLSSFVNFKTEKEISMEDIRKGKYEVIGDFGKSLLVFGNAIYDLKPSDEKLGEVYENEKIKLKIFSTAKELNLIIKKEDKDVKMPFEYKNNFIWEISLSTDYYGSYYKYEAVYPDKKLYGIDPHAALTYDNNKWAIFRKDDTEVSDGPKIDLSDIIIYEMSVRDFTIDRLSGIANKGKYLGIAEDNSTHQNFKEIKTGISHLKELGVNAVHIMPFYDFEKDENTEDYDWGYMPVSYNSPEGWFSVDKKEKISETKKMIDSLHKNGIKVIMDVVYNHTAETGGKVYNFQTSAYDYFYRKKDDGSYYNGSGCGNEFKSDSPYGRKFIIDSLKYWVKEYKIDGFRFDLMGLIDLETVDELIKELKKIKPDIIIYGEPWAAGETPIRGVSKGKQKNKGFSVFNDDLRDALKGSVFHIEDLGYVQNGNYREKVIEGIKGSINTFTDSPMETINYVSCHDNHTLFDRLKLSMPEDKNENIIKRHKLAQSIVFVSQGIPFILSGEEFLRTKYGNENSYNAPDETNKIDWTRKKEFLNIFSYYKDLIKLRKEHPAFKMKTKKEIEENIKFYEDLKIPLPDSKSIAFLIDGNKAKDQWKKILVLINPNEKELRFNLPKGKWKEVFNSDGFKKQNKFYSKNYKSKEISLTVLVSE